MKLIVGLGNPGDKYKSTRHNAGFMAVNEICNSGDFSDFKKSDKFNAEITEGQIADEKVLLVKPQTFMNKSGESVFAIMNFYKLTADDLIVIFDDVDITYGNMRIRLDGSGGGHKGMQSIIEKIGTQKFIRIRIGIKSDFRGLLEDYVLGKLTDDQKNNLQTAVNQIPYAVGMILEGETEKAMNEFNS